MQIPALQYMEGRIKTTGRLILARTITSTQKNERINLYVGGLLGWQMGRIETTLPYTGVMVNDKDMDTDGDDTNLQPSQDPSGQDNSPVVDDGDVTGTPLEVYIPNSKAGQIFGFTRSSRCGYRIQPQQRTDPGFEVQPVAYRYDMIQIIPKGTPVYKVGHHNINLFALPNLKIGFRF